MVDLVPNHSIGCCISNLAMADRKNITRAKKATWIDEETASKMLGLKPATIKIYISKGKLAVRRSKVTYKAKSMFVKEDIDTLLNQKIIQP